MHRSCPCTHEYAMNSSTQPSNQYTQRKRMCRRDFGQDDVIPTSPHVSPLTRTERIGGYLRTQLNSVISLQPNSSSIKRGLQGDIRVSSTLRQSGAHLKTSIAAVVVTPVTLTPPGVCFTQFHFAQERSAPLRALHPFKRTP